MITAEHKRRVEEYIQIGVDEGAKLRLDGRGVHAEGLPDVFFVGPTVFDDVTPAMRIAQEEIFGPVLSVMRAASLDEAIAFANATPFGNGNSIFTASGGAARKFRNEIECGMIGINAGVPAPMAFFSFGGHKRSIFGDLRVHGPDGIEFYTKKRRSSNAGRTRGPRAASGGSKRAERETTCLTTPSNNCSSCSLSTGLRGARRSLPTRSGGSCWKLAWAKTPYLRIAPRSRASTVVIRAI